MNAFVACFAKLLNGRKPSHVAWMTSSLGSLALGPLDKSVILVKVLRWDGFKK